MTANNQSHASPTIPAATVVLLRDREAEVELLMLQRSKSVDFAGMWVFPGGKLDAEDYDAGKALEPAARNAAVRETTEETGLALSGEDFILFSHWTAPPTSPKRYATWFFACEADTDDTILVDGQEILNHRWINPAKALQLHAENQIDLAAPTWITLHKMSQHKTTQSILHYLNSIPCARYQTHLVKNRQGVLMGVWEGDSAYETSDVNAPGDQRHRLTFADNGFVFECTL